LIFRSSPSTVVNIFCGELRVFRLVNNFIVVNEFFISLYFRSSPSNVLSNSFINYNNFIGV
ncbi:hypothetical protein L9F63_027270, partial [Diploptera punctata]